MESNTFIGKRFVSVGSSLFCFMCCEFLFGEMVPKLFQGIWNRSRLSENQNRAEKKHRCISKRKTMEKSKGLASVPRKPRQQQNEYKGRYNDLYKKYGHQAPEHKRPFGAGIWSERIRSGPISKNEGTIKGPPRNLMPGIRK